MADNTTKVELGGPVKSVDTATGVHTLGHVRLRDLTTNEIILIPAPSDDPKGPLELGRYIVCHSRAHDFMELRV
jgi:hypothetical protein